MSIVVGQKDAANDGITPPIHSRKNNFKIYFKNYLHEFKYKEKTLSLYQLYDEVNEVEFNNDEFNFDIINLYDCLECTIDCN